MPKKQFQELSYNPDLLKGISAKTIDTHHGKLYKGYVDKSNDIKDKLGPIAKSGNAEKTFKELMK